MPGGYNRGMGRVQVLPEILAHQIAAGEIVERPASVIKELLENALDAEASDIVVEAENGGRAMMLVRDNGFGMTPEDARLAFQHHATSKIRSMEDLTRIATLGFRGEALPSIASISRLRLRTVEKGRQPPLGTEVLFEGGKLQAVREISWPRGTEVAVENLFYNVPARRKFLKTVSTELSHLTRQVMQYALAYPSVSFRFLHEGRSLLEAAAATDIKERVYQVLGETFLDNLARFDFEKEGVRVHGFASLPHEQRSSGNWQFLYVNGRMVRDRVLTHAVRQAYQDAIPLSVYPVVLLFVEVDPALVDVNVHPSKTEIRFRDSNLVHSAVFHGIEEGLLRSNRGLASVALDLPGERTTQATGDYRDRIARSFEDFYRRSREWPEPPLNSETVYTARDGPGTLLRDPPAGSTDPHADCIPETAHLSLVPQVLGQFVESFVVAVDREGVMLIDQHVAHERILYDRALQALESDSGCPTQRLLLPLTIELNLQQQATLEEILNDLNANGFEVEWFGARTIVIKGVPAIAGDCDSRRLIEEILDGLDAGRAEVSGGKLRRLREKIAISVSCRAAIKVNTPLSLEKIQWLLDELMRCDNPYTCPHGRPIVLRLGIMEILRGFKRI
jgi:DNA mismatch repair protein MutL